VPGPAAAKAKISVTHAASAVGRTLRIWQVAESYPPVYGGGAAIYIRDACQALAEGGHEVRVLSTSQWDGEPYDVRIDHDGPVQVQRVNLPYFRSKDPEGFQLGLRKWRQHERRVAQVIEDALGEWRPDVVVYSATRPLGEQCLITLRELGLPIIAWLHEAWLICPRLMLLRSPTAEPCSGPGSIKCLECMYSEYDGTHARAAVKLSWRIPRIGPYFAYRIWRRAIARRQLIGAYAYSDFMVDVNRPHIPGPVLKVPLGLNLDGLPAEHPTRPRHPLRFGFMGGFQIHKGVSDVLDAAAALKRGGLDFELHIWGPGQDDARNELLNRDLQDRVVQRGMYEGSEVWDAYAAIDVAIIATTVVEPFGRIPVEAAAMGAPTIGVRVGGITESIRDEENGLLYDFRDAAGLTRQMRRVLEEPGLYERLQQGLSKPIDTRTIGEDVEAAYRTLLAQGPRKS
jgi:glycosyltransferase involved in cell wall biosynthesis